MSQHYDEYYWEKLDNAAKIYPSATSRNATNVYRLTIKLNEMVDPDILQKALDITLDELPYYNSKLRKGFFWYYFERNFDKPTVTEDNQYPCRRIEKFSNKGFLIKITYFVKKINIEMFHVLTDGSGCIHFTKILLMHYFNMKYPQLFSDKLPIDSDSLSPSEMLSDSFLRHYLESDKEIKPYKPKAYKIKGVPVFNSELKVIHGIVSTSAMIALAKKNGVTMTVYLAALLLYAIYKEDYQYNIFKNRPIEISVPVNLRPFYGSNTLRNFFSVVSTGMNFFSKEYSFDEVLDFVKNDLKGKITKESLAAKMKYSVGAQQNPILRVIPNIIKDFALKIVYYFAEKSSTSTVTNIGQIKLPPEIEQFIDRFELCLWVTPIQKKKMAVVSFKDELVISMMSGVEETSIEQFIYKHLASNGVPVTISCNEKTGFEESSKLIKRKLKKA